ncbi:DUF2061 domain-containing protein [Roseivirga misakiensis]|uniref:DUF2061 domain-containing protein n=1 Tax=Roseivirga misakiensis TaxID=1563681 RepID=A0A1E5SK94_9BACT|nr:DUF2061 domain-containing protein [Roseivirga misakiensis]OEJ99521.1 hypothetical protein BFP71_08050 [Roseivirga misakiensis]
MLLDTVINRKVEANASGADSNLRSLLKTISWRILGTLDTIIISYFVTGEVAMALSIGSVEVVSKMILYYLHERAWANVKSNK